MKLPDLPLPLSLLYLIVSAVVAFTRVYWGQFDVLHYIAKPLLMPILMLWYH